MMVLFIYVSVIQIIYLLSVPFMEFRLFRIQNKSENFFEKSSCIQNFNHEIIFLKIFCLFSDNLHFIKNWIIQNPKLLKSVNLFWKVLYKILIKELF